MVLFSGFDIIGNLLNGGPRFIEYWSIAKHLEWWAGTYQYSSMTTQLFWVPNHALGAWLIVGLLCRDGHGDRLDPTLPILVVAAALWSPLSALGIAPFVLWKVISGATRNGSLSILHPRVWAPALAVGLVVAAYLSLDPGRIPKGFELGQATSRGVGMDLLRQAQFFLLEAGLIGFAVLAIRRSSEIVLALVILALLPLIYFGPGNDLVMRASIPALTVLAIGACLALSTDVWKGSLLKKKVVLACMLAIGAVTPIQEFARAGVLHSWPINFDATLIGVSCGAYPPHYIAHLSSQLIGIVLRARRPLSLGPQGSVVCDNPAIGIMYKRGLL
jgi:hypothetical protein